jgi:hypothetical protein
MKEIKKSFEILFFQNGIFKIINKLTNMCRRHPCIIDYSFGKLVRRYEWLVLGITKKIRQKNTNDGHPPHIAHQPLELVMYKRRA